MVERWEDDLYECEECGEFYDEWVDAKNCEYSDRFYRETT